MHDTNQISKKQSNKLAITNYLVFPSGIFEQAPYNSNIPLSFIFLTGSLASFETHYLKSFIMSSTFDEFNGVNE